MASFLASFGLHNPISSALVPPWPHKNNTLPSSPHSLGRPPRGLLASPRVRQLHPRAAQLFVPRSIQFLPIPPLICLAEEGLSLPLPIHRHASPAVGCITAVCRSFGRWMMPSAQPPFPALCLLKLLLMLACWPWAGPLALILGGMPPTTAKMPTRPMSAPRPDENHQRLLSGLFHHYDRRIQPPEAQFMAQPVRINVTIVLGILIEMVSQSLVPFPLSP